MQTCWQLFIMLRHALPLCLGLFVSGNISKHDRGRLEKTLENIQNVGRPFQTRLKHCMTEMRLNQKMTHIYTKWRNTYFEIRFWQQMEKSKWKISASKTNTTRYKSSFLPCRPVLWKKSSWPIINCNIIFVCCNTLRKTCTTVTGQKILFFFWRRLKLCPQSLSGMVPNLAPTSCWQRVVDLLAPTRPLSPSCCFCLSSLKK